MEKRKIAVAGTGYVGLSIATLLSQKHQVTAVDIVPEKVEMINNRKSPIQDEYIEKYLTEKELNLTATLDAEAAYSDADFVVIAAPTNYDSRTQHFETVVLLSKGEIDSKKVRVEFSLEDMDMSGFQKGATYEQIKAYVLEHTGLKVSSLYISQIKRKCGLDVGQNYNLSKKEDAKVPKCPPEKEAAIRDALKYFQMI